MLIKFIAGRMVEYQGVDGLGGSLALKGGDTAEVSESVGKLLLQKYGQHFTVVIEERPEHAPQADKLFRKGRKTKTK